MKSMLREPITAIDGVDMTRIFFRVIIFFGPSIISLVFLVSLVAFGHVVDLSFQLFWSLFGLVVLVLGAKDWGNLGQA